MTGWMLLAALCVLAPVPTRAAAPEGLGTFPLPECAVGLELDRQDPAYITARLRPQCPLQLDSARRAFRELLKRVLRESPNLSGLSVFLGRAVDFPWLSRAIAERASRSRDWDAAAGHPRLGGPEDLVRRLLQEIPELPTLFDGWHIRSFSVEKVLITDAGTLGLSSKNVQADARLPYDGMIWVRLQRVRYRSSH